MLASPADHSVGLPTDATVWAFEVKWDGMRVLADISGSRLHLRSRSGRDVSVAFPEFAALGDAHADVLLDGEIVVFRAGVPSFGALAERFNVVDARRASGLAAKSPATLVVFDVLRLYGVDICPRPWTERREVLERLLSGPGEWPGVLLSPVYDDGEALFAATREQGLEGVVAKRRTSRYAEGARNGDWIKVPHRRHQLCLVGGWRRESSGRDRIGGLLLGVLDDSGGLSFAGRAGSGLTGTMQTRIREVLTPLVRAASPFTGEVPVPRADAAGAVWVEPRVVVEVRYLSRSENGRLRQPVLLGLRTDVDPATVRRD
jgi:bifunctional non-homologous end joining protein LigD